MNAAAILIFIISVLIICVLLLVIVYLVTKDSDSDSSSSDDDSTLKGSDDTSDDASDNNSDDTSDDGTIIDLFGSDNYFSADVKKTVFPYLLYGVIQCMENEGGVDYSTTSTNLKAHSSNYTLQYTINSDNTLTFVLKWKGKSQTFTYNDSDSFGISSFHALARLNYDTDEEIYDYMVDDLIKGLAKDAIC